MFERILIANRGEVAARVARTCRRVGIETIGVHTAYEAEAPHVEACDSSVLIGDSPDAYADVDRLVAAAKDQGVQAVHPGYGIARAELALAQALEAAGIVYVGGPAEKLAAAGDRLRVRAIAEELGIRTLPGSERAIVEPNDALADVDRVGYPVVVKRAYAFAEPDALPAIEDVAALSDVLTAIAAPAYMERWVERARHVEVQLLHAGNGEGAVTLGDREVSLRRGQRRVFAESPAVGLTELFDEDATRGAMWEASSDIATALGYPGLLSCHFILDADGSFAFLGVTPGLQVEHSTAEMCCGIDLVEMQVRLAAGEPMPPEALRAEPTGCAVQARVDAATDPRDGRAFESRVDQARWPPAPQGKVRIETGVKVGSTILPDYDPMLASVTTYAPTRHDAILTLDRVLAEIHLGPVVTNLRLLRKALNHESLRARQYDDGFLDRI
jgi:3-methylcrotonyl-CoA carboxylase alpha subunit